MFVTEGDADPDALLEGLAGGVFVASGVRDDDLETVDDFELRGDDDGDLDDVVVGEDSALDVDVGLPSGVLDEVGVESEDLLDVVDGLDDIVAKPSSEGDADADPVELFDAKGDFVEEIVGVDVLLPDVVGDDEGVVNLFVAVGLGDDDDDLEDDVDGVDDGVTVDDLLGIDEGVEATVDVPDTVITGVPEDERDTDALDEAEADGDSDAMDDGEDIVDADATELGDDAGVGDVDADPLTLGDADADPLVEATAVPDVVDRGDAVPDTVPNRFVALVEADAEGERDEETDGVAVGLEDPLVEGRGDEEVVSEARALGDDDVDGDPLVVPTGVPVDVGESGAVFDAELEAVTDGLGVIDSVGLDVFVPVGDATGDFVGKGVPVEDFEIVDEGVALAVPELDLVIDVDPVPVVVGTELPDEVDVADELDVALDVGLSLALGVVDTVEMTEGDVLAVVDPVVEAAAELVTVAVACADCDVEGDDDVVAVGAVVVVASGVVDDEVESDGLGETEAEAELDADFEALVLPDGV